jgi:hypothetical protein
MGNVPCRRGLLKFVEEGRRLYRVHDVSIVHGTSRRVEARTTPIFEEPLGLRIGMPSIHLHGAATGINHLGSRRAEAGVRSAPAVQAVDPQLSSCSPGRKISRSVVDAVSIREWPPETEDWTIPGHWEGDLIAGSGNSHIAALIEGHLRFSCWSKC